MNQRWPSVKLGEVLRLDLDKVFTDPTKSYEMVGVLSYGKGLFNREPVMGGNTSYRFFYRLNQEHLVMSQLFGWEGAIALSKPDFEGKFVSPQFPTFICDQQKIDRQFLGWIIKSRSIWDELGNHTTGMGDRRRTLNPDVLLDCEIPLPSLDEQRLIVTYLDAIAARIKVAQHECIIGINEIKAVLQSSRNAVTQNLMTRFPNVHLGQVCMKITDGPHVSPNYVSDGIPFISVRNISEYGIDFSNAKYISHSDHIIFSKKANVEEGDVLYTKGGTTGIARRVDTQRPFSIWVHVALLKLRKELVIPGYIEHMLNAPSSKEQAEFYTHGSSNRDLGLSRMCKIKFPLAPIAEQRKIVATLDNIIAQIEPSAKSMEEMKRELNALLPSILEKMFKGRGRI